MRLFIATPIKIPFFNKLKDAIKPHIIGNFTKEENLHLTHIFIGEANIKSFKFNLSIPKEPITIKGFNFFNDKILYLKANSANIDSIYKQLEKKGLIKQQKPFKPHITIARIKKIKDKKALLKALEPFNNIELNAPFEVYLYSSTLTPKGPIYKKVYKY